MHSRAGGASWKGQGEFRPWVSCHDYGLGCFVAAVCHPFHHAEGMAADLDHLAAERVEAGMQPRSPVVRELQALQEVPHNRMVGSHKGLGHRRGRRGSLLQLDLDIRVAARTRDILLAAGSSGDSQVVGSRPVLLEPVALALEGRQPVRVLQLAAQPLGPCAGMLGQAGGSCNTVDSNHNTDLAPDPVEVDLVGPVLAAARSSPGLELARLAVAGPQAARVQAARVVGRHPVAVAVEAPAVEAAPLQAVLAVHRPEAGLQVQKRSRQVGALLLGQCLDAGPVAGSCNTADSIRSLAHLAVVGQQAPAQALAVPAVAPPDLEEPAQRQEEGYSWADKLQWWGSLDSLVDNCSLEDTEPVPGVRSSLGLGVARLAVVAGQLAPGPAWAAQAGPRLADPLERHRGYSLEGKLPRSGSSGSPAVDSCSPVDKTWPQDSARLEQRQRSVTKQVELPCQQQVDRTKHKNKSHHASAAPREDMGTSLLKIHRQYVPKVGPWEP